MTDADREAFEAQAKDSFNFSRSRKGTYNNPAVARDWKWFAAGCEHVRALAASEAYATMDNFNNATGTYPTKKDT